MIFELPRSGHQTAQPRDDVHYQNKQKRGQRTMSDSNSSEPPEYERINEEMGLKNTLAQCRSNQIERNLHGLRTLLLTKKQTISNENYQRKIRR